VAAVGAQEHVLPTAAVLGRAGAPRPGLGLDLPGKQLGQERREVDGQAGFPVRAAVGVVLGREPVEGAADLAELPFDVDLVVVDVVAFQADRLAPADPFSGDPQPVVRRCTRPFAESFCNTSSWVWCSLSLLL